MTRRLDVCRGCPRFIAKEFHLIQDTFSYYACDGAWDEKGSILPRVPQFRIKQDYEQMEVPSDCHRVMENMVLSQ